MRLRTPPHPLSGPRGFSMIELLVVVGLIALMAAVGLPNFIGYLRNARVRGATQEVAGELQIARNRAIRKNVNPSDTGGVVFAILDADSYRFTVLDDNDYTVAPPNRVPGLAPLRDLPQGIVFVPGAVEPVFGVAFDAMGKLCKLGAPTPAPPCSPMQTVDEMCGDNKPGCRDKPTGSFIDLDPTDTSKNTLRIRVRESSTGIERTVSIQMGGKVQSQK